MLVPILSAERCVWMMQTCQTRSSSNLEVRPPSKLRRLQLGRSVTLSRVPVSIEQQTIPWAAGSKIVPIVSWLRTLRTMQWNRVLKSTLNRSELTNNSGARSKWADSMRLCRLACKILTFVQSRSRRRIWSSLRRSSCSESKWVVTSQRRLTHLCFKQAGSVQCQTSLTTI